VPLLSRGGILLSISRSKDSEYQGKGGMVDLVKPGKVAAVDELKKKLGEAQGVVLVDYRGLNVSSLMNLRRKLDESKSEFRVVKNTLTKMTTNADVTSSLRPGQVTFRSSALTSRKNLPIRPNHSAIRITATFPTFSESLYGRYVICRNCSTS
jgi:hypothetical protein